ncbi:hypothetical protein NEOLEDRAFT_249765 [Neolentinus lepideus HHB14362 ss-1]|uniref:Uncharacterized protein n=1 Tax=Neolentinus lepideus HHB14362 ss-1 TaxID=1314782 RepID=A0A165T953_9AGAM|nr:hypothetical protein NEOLEDRAFT_249765 [Neolentinus lepideus HHB14362 ss-1]
MPRRPPPTALRLVPGPTPPRGVPKHTLPSMPQPTFQPPTIIRGPTPRTRADVGAPPAAQKSLQAGLLHDGQMSLPALFLLSTMGMEVSPTPRSSSPTSNSSNKTFVPGPWDHSRSIAVSVDVDALLAAPKPAAVSPVTGLGWMMI